MEEFKAFEHRGWNDSEVADKYGSWFVPLTSQSVEPLLDAAGIESGKLVLDVATGIGTVAAAAASRGAQVSGIDFSLAMVELARRLYPDLDFREGDAES